MKVRGSVIAAAMGASLVLGAKGASAEPPAPSTSGVPPPPQPVLAVDRLLTQPVLKGDAWTRAVQAVIEGVRRAMEQDRLAVQKVVTAALPTTPKSAQPSAFRAVLPTTVRDMVDTAPVILGPVAGESVGAGTIDRRGERSSLLGATIELPWMVP